MHSASLVRINEFLNCSDTLLTIIHCVQILYHVCECLMDLHKEGFVHRDLKPGNIMWLPSQNRWTLIDFGCVAKIDSDARMGFSLMYAAPEVVLGVFRERRETCKASTALGAWSVGVLAVELFTGRPALRLIEGREKARPHLAMPHIGLSLPDSATN